ncbi:MAG TPA: two-component regulator propeller domain-containing protein, partial [Bacillota bacterium]|nr:two-component regulator propeller domain-containing protein [Bacillota bacterium]
GLPNLGIGSVWEDRHGTLWAGTAGAGLYAWRGQGFTAASAERLEANVLAVHELADGTLWIGTETGPARLADGRWIWAARELGVNIPHVRCFAQTPDGALWFGSLGGGLARVLAGRLTLWRKADGLASDYVWSLHAEPDGTLWVGTYGGGLSRFKHGQWATLSSRQGLPSDVICCILNDDQGNLWMSSYAGIFSVACVDLDSCAEGRLKALSCLRLDSDDGLNSLEMSGGCQPAGCRTADGRLWFATSKGLAVVNPATLHRNQLPPPVRIEEVLVDEQFFEEGRRQGGRDKAGAAASPSLRPPSGLSLPPGKNRLEIRYTGLSFGGADKVRFKYKLHGLDDDWVEAGPRRFAFYSQVPPGDYLFRVKACNSDGVWNETGVSLPLVVAPFFWQVYWFQALALLSLLAGVGGAIALVQRRQHRRQLHALQVQQALEQERVRIAQDIHDDVGSGLTQLLLLGKLAQRPALSPEQVRLQVATMTQRTRDIVRAMDEIVWAVNPQNDSLANLGSYLSTWTQEFLDAAGMRCRLDLAPELPPIPLRVQIRHNLFLAVREALNNAAKHSGATEVWLRVHWAESALHLSIEDNGRGFEPDAAAAGNGLTNLRDRLQAIGGRCEIQS